MPRSVISFFLFLLVLASFASCGHLTSESDKIPLPAVSIHRYSNGLQLVVVEDHHFPVISYQTWLRAGSANEEPNVRGVAHFLEHMMFKKSGNFPSLFFDQYLSLNGAESNANTSYDRTIFYQQIPSSLFYQTVLLELDRWTNLSLDASDIEVERKIILDEYRNRLEHSEGAILQNSLMNLSALTAEYAAPVMGWQDDLERIGQIDLEHFYKKYYRPENMTVILSGDITLAQARRYFDSSFGLWFPKKTEFEKVVSQKKEHLQFANPSMAGLGVLYFQAPNLVSNNSFLYDFLVFILSDYFELHGDPSLRASTQYFPLVHQGRFIMTGRSNKLVPQQILQNNMMVQFRQACSNISSSIVSSARKKQYYYGLKALQQNATVADQVAYGVHYYNDPYKQFLQLSQYDQINASDLRQACNSMVSSKFHWGAR